MLKIGLTGGIGSGKSTVAKLFAELGSPQIDADQIAHELVDPGKATLLTLEKAFGKEIITASGALDRKKLKGLIFSNPEKKKQLESIMHPLIYAEIQKKIDHLKNKYVIISIPLLLETKMTDFVDRVLVVDCPVALQISRVKTRDTLDSAFIEEIIFTQVTREQRLSAADDIIDNTYSTQQLAAQVKKLHNSYMST